MSVVYVVVAIVLAVALAGSAVAKLRRVESVTTSLTGVGVPLSWFPPLAAVELAGAAGLLVGIAWRPLGVAAAIGVVLYFLGAVLAHVRARDVAGMPPAAGLLAFAVVATWSALATA